MLNRRKNWKVWRTKIINNISALDITVKSINMEKKKKKYIIEAWAEVEYLEYRTYEIEAESEEDAKERFEEDGIIIDTIESDCDTHSVRFAKIYKEN